MLQPVRGMDHFCSEAHWPEWVMWPHSALPQPEVQPTPRSACGEQGWSGRQQDWLSHTVLHLLLDLSCTLQIRQVFRTGSVPYISVCIVILTYIILHMIIYTVQYFYWYSLLISWMSPKWENGSQALFIVSGAAGNVEKGGNCSLGTE